MNAAECVNLPTASVQRHLTAACDDHIDAHDVDTLTPTQNVEVSHSRDRQHQEHLQGPGPSQQDPVHDGDDRALPSGRRDPCPGRRLDRHRPAPGGCAERRARAVQPVLGRRLRELLDLRPRDHAVHHRQHHHAGARRRDPQARRAPAAGCGRSAQDHPVHPLRHDRAGDAAGNRARVPVRHRRRRRVLLGGPGTVGPAAARRHLAARLPHHPDARRRHGRADVDGRADHPARHRQRHVDGHLRLRRVRHAERLLRDLAGQQGVLVLRDDRPDDRDHHRRRVRRARATPNPGAVRQTCRRPPDDGRPEHLHPAEGQPVGRHPDHLRQLDPAAAGDPRQLPRQRHRAAGAARSSSTSTATSSTARTPCTSRCSRC